MPLASQLGSNIAAIQLPEMKIPISCHLASIIWLFREVFNREPSVDELKKIVTANPNTVIKKIATAGSVRVAPVAKSGISISPSSVIVFMYLGEPKHSCVAKSMTQIGGYNQTGWFTGKGVDHGYSEHAITEFRWGKGANVNQVQGNNNNWCALHSTIEPIAKREFEAFLSG